MNKLTPKETIIVGLVAAGLTTKEIAAKIFKSESTIKFHLDNIRSKLEAKNTTHAICKYYAIEAANDPSYNDSIRYKLRSPVRMRLAA